MDEKESTNNNDRTGEQVADISVPERDEKGRLLPGNTANLKGRPKKKRFEDYFTDEEREDLIIKLKTSDRPDIWYKLAEMIFGKSKQPLVGGDENDEPIKITGINYIKPDGNYSTTYNQTGSSVSSTK